MGEIEEKFPQDCLIVEQSKQLGGGVDVEVHLKNVWINLTKARTNGGICSGCSYNPKCDSENKKN